MNRIHGAAATIAALALTASLGTSVIATDEPQIVGDYKIEGLTWLLTSQMVDGEMVEMPEGITVSLLMEDGAANGTGSCNNYFTSYELDGHDLTFGEIGSTLMACPEPVMAAEQAYFANLGNVAAYQSGGIQMAFLDADGEFILEWDLAPEPNIVGSWVATGINDQKPENAGVVSSDTTSLITAEYGPDGDLAGFDGCNDYFTTYVVEGDRITIAPEIGQTMMACPDDALAEQAQWYYGALAAASTWSVDANGNLDLRDEDGSRQVIYAPAE